MCLNIEHKLNKLVFINNYYCVNNVHITYMISIIVDIDPLFSTITHMYSTIVLYFMRAVKPFSLYNKTNEIHSTSEIDPYVREKQHQFFSKVIGQDLFRP